MKKFLLALTVLCITSCSTLDWNKQYHNMVNNQIDFMWEQMAKHYEQPNAVIPEIIYHKKKMYDEEGYRILGAYQKSANTVHLFAGWGMDTIEHEFGHALGIIPAGYCHGIRLRSILEPQW